MDKVEPQTYVLWSGGFDSTAVLLNLLIKGIKTINLTSHRLGNNEKQLESEDNARNAILEQIKKTPGYESVVLPVQYNGWCEINAWNRGWRSTQSVIWACSVILAAPFEGPSNFYTGYRFSDCVTVVWPEFKAHIATGCLLFGKPTPELFEFSSWKDEDFITPYLYFPGVFEKLSWMGDNEKEKAEKKEKMTKLYNDSLGQLSLRDSML